MSSVPLDELRRLRATFWNPVGVPMVVDVAPCDDEHPMPADEYDTYLLQAYGLARQGCSATDIETFLSSVERDQLGVSTSDADKRAFAKALQDRWGTG